MLKFFGDTLHALDDSLAGLVVLVVPAVGIYITHWLREQLLRSKAKTAALEAELEHAGDDAVDDDTLVNRAMAKVDAPAILGVSSDKMRKLVLHESRVASRKRKSQEAPLPPVSPMGDGDDKGAS